MHHPWPRLLSYLNQGMPLGNEERMHSARIMILSTKLPRRKRRRFVGLNGYNKFLHFHRSCACIVEDASEHVSHAQDWLENVIEESRNFLMATIARIKAQEEHIEKYLNLVERALEMATQVCSNIIGF